MKWHVLLITALMTVALVQPALAYDFNPLELLLHPGYIIKQVMQLIGLEKSTEAKLTSSQMAGAGADPAAMTKAAALRNLLSSLSTTIQGTSIGFPITEHVFIGFQEGDTLYLGWNVKIQNGVMTEFKEKATGKPTLFVRLDSYAIDQLLELQPKIAAQTMTQDEALKTLELLYLDGHLEAHPMSKLFDYGKQLMGTFAGK